MISPLTKTHKLYKNHQPARMPDPEDDSVESRVLTALKTLRAVPDPDAKILKQFDGRAVSWPEVIRQEEESYGYDVPRTKSFNPKPRDVSRMLGDLAWLNGLDKKQFRLIWWRSFDLPFSYIAARIGRSDETARRRYREALMEVRKASPESTCSISA